ncbi:uncharacterized protein PADG_11333 [Paracoccidioides brasiliensis Pb18]|uniref:Uncharacterized protein n=1 Tax=Paracoccidioides brasiliensis (strain Pb18) TaxID=502780 RepID=A0A0A0HYR7_PARBD|nr:uncharacterized protein PADG_11333 [Paracoccidioides brasiliensis Pb18]KGM92510.1 hypothetical protein PADG_11333 [Paracoccidioides brasiliensis Pb18]
MGSGLSCAFPFTIARRLQPVGKSVLGGKVSMYDLYSDHNMALLPPWQLASSNKCHLGREGFYGIFTIHFQQKNAMMLACCVLLRDIRPKQPSIKRAATDIAVGFINTLPGSFAIFPFQYHPKNTVNDKVFENYNGQPKQDKRADRDPDVVSILQNGMLATQYPNVTFLVHGASI